MRSFRYLFGVVLACIIGALSAADSTDAANPPPLRQWTYNGRTYLLPNPQATATDEGIVESLPTAPMPTPVINSTAPVSSPETSSWFGTILLAVIVVSVATMFAMLVFSQAARPPARRPITAFSTVARSETSPSEAGGGNASTSRNRKKREYTSTSIFVRSESAANREHETEETVRVSDERQFSEEEPAVITSRIAAKHREAQRRSTGA